mgnify:CR=1 FL=1
MSAAFRWTLHRSTPDSGERPAREAEGDRNSVYGLPARFSPRGASIQPGKTTSARSADLRGRVFSGRPGPIFRPEFGERPVFPALEAWSVIGTTQNGPEFPERCVKERSSSRPESGERSSSEPIATVTGFL